jgi:hypothetical protein
MTRHPSQSILWDLPLGLSWPASCACGQVLVYCMCMHSGARVLHVHAVGCSCTACACGWVLMYCIHMRSGAHVLYAHAFWCSCTACTCTRALMHMLTYTLVLMYCMCMHQGPMYCMHMHSGAHVLHARTHRGLTSLSKKKNVQKCGTSAFLPTHPTFIHDVDSVLSACHMHMCLIGGQTPPWGEEDKGGRAR